MQEAELAVYEVGGCAVSCPASDVYTVEALVEKGPQLGQFWENEGLSRRDGELQRRVCFETER